MGVFADLVIFFFSRVAEIGIFTKNNAVAGNFYGI